MLQGDIIEDKYFCYLYIEQFGSAIIALGITCIVVVFMVRILMQYMQARRSGRINNPIQITYVIMIGLCVSYIPQIVVSQTFFWLSYLGERVLTNQTAQIISKYIFVMQFIQQILFETILLLISYNWLANILAIFRQILEQGEIGYHFRRQKILYRVIKIFMFIRLLQFGICVVFVISGDADFLDTLAKITFGVFTLQEVFTLISFILLISLLRRNKKLKQQVQESGITKMMMNYTFLVILLLINIIWNIWYLIQIVFDIFEHLKPTQCKIKTQEKWNIDDILQMIIMITLNLCAFVIVLRLYRVDKQVDKSIIFEGTDEDVGFKNRPEIKSDLMQ